MYFKLNEKEKMNSENFKKKIEENNLAEDYNNLLKKQQKLHKILCSNNEYINFLLTENKKLFEKINYFISIKLTKI